MRTQPAAASGVTTRVTRRGLEITVPRPYLVQGCLAPVLILLVVLAPAAWIVVGELGTEAREWFAAVGAAVGVWWLAAALGAAVLTLGFGRYSNEHYVFGTRTVRDQGRLGRVVISDNDVSLARIGEVEVVPAATAPAKWCVRCASKRVRAWPALLISPLERDEAERVADRVRQWLDAPGELPIDAEHEVPAPVLLAETALALLTSRIVLAVPFLVGAASLLVLALGWQLREAQRGGGEPLPRLDRVADGELRAYRWVLRPPWEARDADWPHRWSVGLELAIAYTPEDGRPRTLWLTTRRLWREGVGHFGPGQFRRAAALFGPPPLEFLAPDWAGAGLSDGAGWAEWRAVAYGPHRWDDAHRAAGLLSRLDDPFHYLVARWTAPAADWRVAYDAADPDRAVPLRWAEAERRAMQQVSFGALLPAGVVALMLAFWTLPRLVAPPRSRRWIGRVAVLIAVLAVPWWAGLAERAAMRVGVGGWAADLAADVLRLGAPEAYLDHAWIGRSRPPSRPAPGIVVHWAPERSAWAGLLAELGLLEPPAELPLPDSAAATAFMVARATAAITALDDEALAAFALRHLGDGDGDERETDPLHRVVLVPAFCAVLGDRRASGRPVPSSLPRGPCEPATATAHAPPTRRAR